MSYLSIEREVSQSCAGQVVSILKLSLGRQGEGEGMTSRDFQETRWYDIMRLDGFLI
jgi:hypothetical protein